MGDDEGRATLRQAGQRLLHGQLAFRVQRARGLIEQQDGSIAQKRAGKRDALTLATRKRHPTLAQAGRIALGHSPDEAVGLACLGGACDIGIAGLECAVADVLRDRFIEEGNVLRDQGDLAGARERAERTLAIAMRRTVPTTEADVRRLFGGLPGLLPAVSRSLLRAGPDVAALRATAARLNDELSADQ